jgi:cell division protein FtsQ
MAASLSPAPRFHRPLPVRRRRRFGVLPLLAMAMTKAVALVGAPVALAAWLYFSPYFAIREIEVSAGERVPMAWVAATLAPLRGRHILGVSLEGVRRKLSAHPWVATVELRKVLPDTLRIEVVERRPVALMRTGDGLFYVDARGEGIAPLPAGASFEELVVLRQPSGGPLPVAAALALIEELKQADASWAASVREVEVLGERDFLVETAALPFPLVLRAGRVAEGVDRLQAAQREAARRGVEIGAADLRFPRRIFIQPAAAPAPGSNRPARTEG